MKRRSVLYNNTSLKPRLEDLLSGMVFKTALAVGLFFLIAISSIDAQRDSRRRSGRRKPTTESPIPLTDDAEEERNARKLDAEPEADLAVKSSSAPETEPESSATPSSKDPNQNNQAGPPFLAPRGTRKPRPMAVRGGGEARPKPTLPTFIRKGSGRTRKTDFGDTKKIVSSSETSTASATTAKPTRGSSRRRNSSTQASVDEVAPDSAPKKRFGGGSTRRPSRGGRRGTTEPTES